MKISKRENIKKTTTDIYHFLMASKNDRNHILIVCFQRDLLMLHYIFLLKISSIKPNSQKSLNYPITPNLFRKKSKLAIVVNSHFDVSLINPEQVSSELKNNLIRKKVHTHIITTYIR